MIKVLLFDFDGVIANGEMFSRRLARDYGITLEMTAAFFKGRDVDCLIGKADLKEELELVLPTWGWSESIEAFLRYWFTSEHAMDEQVLRTIEQLRQRNVRCYIATNQEKYRTAYILNEMGMDERVDGMFSSAYIGYMKHSPAFFEAVLRQLPGIQPEEILFWDDSPGNIATARQAGLNAEVYTNFADFISKMDDFTMYSGEAG